MAHASRKLDRNYSTHLSTARNLTIFARVLEIFSFPRAQGNTEYSKLLWVIRLRWLAIFFFSVLSGPALALGWLNSDSVPKFLGVIGILLIFNLLSQFYWSNRKRQVEPVTICFQLAIDLFVLASLLYLSGGFANPLIVLFFLNASIGGILIPGRLSWPFLLMSHTLLAALQFHYFITFQITDESAFVSQVVAFHFMLFAFWVIMRSLGAYLERQRTRETELRILSEKQDRLRSLGALAAGFSHEFASPLNAAKLRIERILRLNPSEDAKEALRAISDCEFVVHQMNSSQLDSRNFVPKKVRLGELTNDIVDSWRDEHPDVQIDLNFDEINSAYLPPLNFA
ncbi:MAG: hypothetical protein EOP06_21465, partial [Proteobacteria bacterium]